MFLVGGGILVHGVPQLHHAVEGLSVSIGGVAGWFCALLANATVGIVAGAITLAAVLASKRLVAGSAAGAGQPPR
jgi:predicted DNA repair protein MutK